MSFSLKIILSVFFLGYFSCQQKQITELDWLDNFDEALQLSSSSNKPILMRFMGSDWCGNCWRLDTALFETAKFVDFAPKEFVLLALDFPVKPENKLSADQTLHNQKLREKYNPSGEFPTVLVLNHKGKVLGQMNVAPSSVEEYIDQLKEIVKGKEN